MKEKIMININSVETACIACFTNRASANSVCPSCGYDESKHETAPHQLRPRTILDGKYLLGKTIGEGGFGITYIGWDLTLDTKVAIKEYYPTGFVTRETTSATTVQPFTGSQGEFFLQGRDKFINEAKILAKFFALPGIVSIRNYFQENGTAYICMEYIAGQTLKAYLASHGGKLPANQVFDMMKPVMTSLAEIHKAGLIHRDISPDNIMITEQGLMKLLDFGAARDFTESGNKSLSIMLKPGFAPEEQYRSRGVQGPWTDIYALSATIYKCITGIAPDESVERVRKDEVKSPSELGISINPGQEEVLMQGMAVLQEKRFQSVAAMTGALYAAITNPVNTLSKQPIPPPPVIQTQTQPQPVIPPPSKPITQAEIPVNTSANPVLQTNSFQANKPKSKKVPLIVAIVSVIVVAGGGFGAFWILNNRDTVPAGGEERSSRTTAVTTAQSSTTPENDSFYFHGMSEDFKIPDFGKKVGVAEVERNITSDGENALIEYNYYEAMDSRDEYITFLRDEGFVNRGVVSTGTGYWEVYQKGEVCVLVPTDDTKPETGFTLWMLYYKNIIDYIR
jgi:serine/threonine protein kinase